jgi:hypothetical protein
VVGKDAVEPFADELRDGGEVELPGEGLSDLVDDRELRVPLPDLGRGAALLQGRGDVLPDEEEEALVLDRVGDLRPVALDCQDADGAALGPERGPRKSLASAPIGANSPSSASFWMPPALAWNVSPRWRM